MGLGFTNWQTDVCFTMHSCGVLAAIKKRADAPLLGRRLDKKILKNDKGHHYDGSHCLTAAYFLHSS